MAQPAQGTKGDGQARDGQRGWGWIGIHLLSGANGHVVEAEHIPLAWGGLEVELTDGSVCGAGDDAPKEHGTVREGEGSSGHRRYPLRSSGFR